MDILTTVRQYWNDAVLAKFSEVDNRGVLHLYNGSSTVEIPMEKVDRGYERRIRGDTIIVHLEESSLEYHMPPVTIARLV